MSQDTYIEGLNLVVAFEQHKVLNDISFRICTGDVVAVVGRNGSGKTTLFSVLQGLLQPASGALNYALNGKLYLQEDFREHIAIQLQKSSHFKQLKVKEILTLYSKISKKRLDKNYIYQCVDLADIEDREVRMLSGGQLQKLNIALAILKDSVFTFFDEPTVGLDVSTRERFVEFLRKERSADKSTLIVTHYLDEIESICTKVLILHGGKIVDFVSPKKLREKYLKAKTIRVSLGGAHVGAALHAIKDIESSHWFDDHALYVTTDYAEAIVSALYQYPSLSEVISDVTIRNSSLQDAFVRSTS